MFHRHTHKLKHVSFSFKIDKNSNLVLINELRQLVSNSQIHMHTYTSLMNFNCSCLTRTDTCFKYSKLFMLNKSNNTYNNNNIIKVLR